MGFHGMANFMESVLGIIFYPIFGTGGDLWADIGNSLERK